jgi:hypothetical protein
LFLMVWSVSFTIDSSFFSKVFILNYVWEKLSSRSSLTTDTFQVIPLISILIWSPYLLFRKPVCDMHFRFD